ncbi:MAG: hypothetical protein EBS05_27420, partial [Proteobacteria bacterium]|nr:hypothetical protein [Pseudomonadota bacterium]
KFQQMAMARQAQQITARKDFSLYIDEFHHFITPSMATILTGARKYRLGLILAHQEVRQLQRDSDVAGAVMANPATRICFRVGDEDARRLADSFPSFTAQDLQNLERGEALCRMERFDFNLRTVPLLNSAPNAYNREAIYQRSRQKYASARSTVEEELARSRTYVEPDPAERVDPFAKRKAKVETPAPEPAERVDPFAKRKAKVETPAPKSEDEKSAAPPPPVPSISRKTPPPADEKKTETRPLPVTQNSRETPLPVIPKKSVAEPPQPPQRGKGGPEHRQLQNDFARLANQLGWRASIEEPVPGGSVDVVFGYGKVTVACEISVTTGVDKDLGSLRKCLAAAFTHIVIVSEDPKYLTKIETAARKTFTAAELKPVHFLEPNGVLGWLEAITAQLASGEKTFKGYRVLTSYKTLTEAEKRNRKEGIGGAVAKALRRSKEGGKK